VAAAVADFAQEINAGTVVDILDAPGTESYPLAYISFISIPNNLTSPDCSLVTDLLTFFSWTQTNQVCSFIGVPLQQQTATNYDCGGLHTHTHTHTESVGHFD
jgi:hypothetical protein